LPPACGRRVPGTIGSGRIRCERPGGYFTGYTPAPLVKSKGLFSSAFRGRERLYERVDPVVGVEGGKGDTLVFEEKMNNGTESIRKFFLQCQGFERR